MTTGMRWGWRAVVALVGCVFVVAVPLGHLSAEEAYRDAVRFTESGRVVTVREPRDIRVSASEFKERVTVERVSVRINGSWHPVRDSGQEEPADVEPWYHRGSQPPLPGRPQWPPLTVLVADGVPDVVRADRASAVRSAGAPGPGYWVADALAVCVAAGLLFWGRRLWVRALG